ncbi:polyadenylate-binding protein 7, partial [Tanacetum coccineum]
SRTIQIVASGHTSECSNTEHEMKCSTATARHLASSNSGIASYSGGTRGDGSEMLSSMLSTASPEIQKQMLGERLYPLVYQHEITSWSHGDGVSQCVMGWSESMCHGRWRLRGYPGRNVGDGNIGMGMLPVPYDMSGMLPRDDVVVAML